MSDGTLWLGSDLQPSSHPADRADHPAEHTASLRDTLPGQNQVFTQKNNTTTPKKPVVVWGPDKHFSFRNMKGKWQYMGFQLLMLNDLLSPQTALVSPALQPLETKATILNSLFSVYSTICIIPGSFPWQGKKQKTNPSNPAIKHCFFFTAGLKQNWQNECICLPKLLLSCSQYSYSSILQDIYDWIMYLGADFTPREHQIHTVLTVPSGAGSND